MFNPKHRGFLIAFPLLLFIAGREFRAYNQHQVNFHQFEKKLIQEKREQRKELRIKLNKEINEIIN